MPANMGVARRLEAANHRIDAAIAAIAPDGTPPAPSRNRGFAEVARAEWIADTLERMAGGPVDAEESGDDLESVGVEEPETSERQGGDVAEVDENPNPDSETIGDREPEEGSAEVDLEAMTVDALRDLAAEREIEGRSGMKKAELIAALQGAE